MNLRYILSFVFLTYLISGYAQERIVKLDEVVIEALPFEKFSSGSKIDRSDSLQLAILGQKTLSDYLQQNTTVYVREQGNKMLASVSFRGTGASHTGVFWHGINLNSMTLGSSDFNGIPLFLFDDIAVQYGGASSLHGSDAIGGSIHLGSQPSWSTGTSFQLRQDVGSFGNYFTGGKLILGNGRWESKTKIFSRSLQNNFDYHIIDRVGDSHEITQQNAEVQNYGIIQEFSLKTSSSSYFSLKGWFGNNEHQIQPMMVAYPGQQQDGEEIFDRNLRMIAEFGKYFKKGLLNSSISYAWDYQLFDNSDLIETKRTMANLSYEWDISEKTLLKLGGFGQHIVPSVWSYEEDLTEWRGDAFISLRQLLKRNWELSFNARKTFVPFTEAPIAPSVSTSYSIDQGKTTMILRAQVERSYRVPTFNDRYWGYQGRHDLKSEQGYSVDVGYNLKKQLDDDQFDLDVSAYYMIVDDWIAWRPAGGIWRPFNLKKVESTGIELNMKYKRQISRGYTEIGGLYAFNRASLLQGISENDPAVGYQLPYTPKHRAVFFLNFLFDSYRFSVNNSFTGQRLGVDVINQKVEGFFLTDISFSKNFRFGRQAISLEGQVLNLFDQEYQNVARYAMPGRNYLISINFFINN